MRTTIRSFVFLAIVLLQGVYPAQASDRWESGWSGIAEAEVRLIAGQTPSGEDALGLQFAMAPKWKVYWRSPGDAGFPPVPKWDGSNGASNFDISWPLPRRFTFYGLETFGYESEVVLPVRLTRSKGPTQIRLALFYAACADICVPVQTEISLNLPAGEWPSNSHGLAIDDALSKAPPHVSADSVDGSARASGDQLTISVRTPTPLTHPDLIVEAPASYVFGRPECHSSDVATNCRVPVVDSPSESGLAGQKLRVTVYGIAGDAFETELIATAE